VIKHGQDDTQPPRQRYHCPSCKRYFDDLPGTIFEGPYQPLSVWILCLYFMGLNLSNRQSAPGTRVYTDEYDLYHRVPVWGYEHKTVCHRHGVYARDEDGDGLHEVHVNTMEGFWSLLRSWLRPHRGLSQEWLPDYLGFFVL
jgi:ISXO2-like transposase domain